MDCGALKWSLSEFAVVTMVTRKTNANGRQQGIRNMASISVARDYSAKYQHIPSNSNNVIYMCEFEEVT